MIEMMVVLYCTIPKLSDPALTITCRQRISSTTTCAEDAKKINATNPLKGAKEKVRAFCEPVPESDPNDNWYEKHADELLKGD